MNQIRAYVSHPIRGAKGVNATREDMERNNQRIIEFARLLRQCYPTIDFYIPAEHDEFVLEAYEQGFISEVQILDADCAIVRKCHVLIAVALDEHISRGMFKEMREASLHNIPMVVIENNEQGLKTIDSYLLSLMRG